MGCYLHYVTISRIEQGSALLALISLYKNEPLLNTDTERNFDIDYLSCEYFRTYEEAEKALFNKHPRARDYKADRDAACPELADEKLSYHDCPTIDFYLGYI